ncbi:MAG TPA: DUF4214 domain-containing protein [Rhodospirillaceae bacterium]|nr:DUF4214 domain-containing protein [Rhodospirillaceae bacterium]
MTTSTIDAFIAAENTRRGNSQPYPPPYSAAPSPTESAVIGWQSAALTTGTATNPAGNGNAILLDGPHSQYAVQVDSLGHVAINDISTGNATSGQSIAVDGAAYILFNGGGSDVSSGLAPDSLFILSNQDSAVALLYQANFGRVPDLAGLEAWRHQYDAGLLTVDQIAQAFIASPEFQGRFGSNLTDAQFVDALYHNVLGRNADLAGETAWNQAVANWQAQGLTQQQARAKALIGFAGSPECQRDAAGWLVNTGRGGYADPGNPLPAQSVMNQAETSGYIDTSLMSVPATNTNIYSSDAVSARFGGVTKGMVISNNSGNVSLDAVMSNGTIVASAAVSNIAVSGSGNLIYGSPNAGGVNIAGGVGNTIALGAGATAIAGPVMWSFDDSGVLTPSSGKATIIGFNPSIDIYYSSIQTFTGQGTRGLVLLDASQGQAFNGTALTFGPAYASTQPLNMLKLGDVGGGSAVEVAAAVNKAYTLAGTPAEHLLIVGQVTQTSPMAAAGDTVLYDYFQLQPTSPTFANADLNHNHLVDANELTFEAKFVGLATSSITAHSFGG